MERVGNILCVLGTRPEAIKLAPVIRALRAHRSLDVTVCVTGQHRQMLDSVLKLFAIVPDVDLDVMRAGQDLTDITTGVLLRLREVIGQRRPDCILVQGDTTTVMAAALAAFYAKVPLAHLEAGLRTGNMAAPWPEELNRRIATLIASLHFCPTEAAADNLRREGAPTERIAVTGNTVIDALFEIMQKIENDDELRRSLEGRFEFLSADRKLILVTGHRRENFGAGFDEICRALVKLSRRGDVQFVYPVHLNPNVQETVRRKLGETANIELLPPLDYAPFVYLMGRAAIVLTDSGGVQEEAPSLGKPVLVMRDTTERPEGVAAGTVKLVGACEETIVAETARLLDCEEAYQSMARAVNPYGDGRAAGRVVNRLAEHFAEEFAK